MPLANFEEYLNLLKINLGFRFNQAGNTGISNRPSLASQYFVPAPSTPTVAIALNSTSPYGIQNSLSNPTLLGGRFSASSSQGSTVLVADLLSISGGLVASVATPQSTNLPTAPLTRYTDGNGVFAAAICYAAVGNNPVTIQSTYVNQSGMTNITPETQFAGSGFTALGRLIILPLASGDTGVRSVTSVTLSGTAGSSSNFGILLFKPLALIGLDSYTSDYQIDAISSGKFVGAFAQALPGACLGIITIGGPAQNLNGTLFLSEV